MSQLSIEFYIKAHAGENEKISIREYFDIKGPKLFPDRDVEFHQEGLVDDAIKQEHAAAYAVFAAYIEANKDQLYPEAKANLDKKFYMKVDAAIEIPEAEEEIKIKEKAKRKKVK